MRNWRQIGARAKRREQGYVLLTLLLTFAVLAIAAGLAATSISFQLKRDREEEMIHRGVQYTRAIRHFVAKQGRYPTSVDELITTRQLRRRYKDPLTNRDFKILSLMDVMRFAGQAPPPKVTTTDADQNEQDATQPGQTADSNGQVTPVGNQSAGVNAAAGASPGLTGAAAGNAVAPGLPGGNSTPPPIGMQIAGVASTSKDRTIREFNHKTKYNEWYFFYHASFDRGLPITGPTPLTLINQSPGMPIGTQMGGAPNQPLSPNSLQQPSPGAPAPPSQQQQ
jgi:type II secretory pathway pseudopilin PulG